MTKLYYVENLGSEKFQNTLVSEQENGAPIVDHPSMQCRDRAGKLIVRNLSEVPYDALLRYRSMIGKDGVAFLEYSGMPGEIPRQDPVRMPARIDPFREARRKRRQNPVRHPGRFSALGDILRAR